MTEREGLLKEVYDLREEIFELRRILEWHSHLVQFHKLDEIDRRYIKFWYERDECPFFETEMSRKKRKSRVVEYEPGTPRFKVENFEGYTSSEGIQARSRMNLYPEADRGFYKEREARAKKNLEEIVKYEEALKQWKSKEET